MLMQRDRVKPLRMAIKAARPGEYFQLWHFLTAILASFSVLIHLFFSFAGCDSENVTQRVEYVKRILLDACFFFCYAASA